MGAGYRVHILTHTLEPTLLRTLLPLPWHAHQELINLVGWKRSLDRLQPLRQFRALLVHHADRLEGDGTGASFGAAGSRVACTREAAAASDKLRQTLMHREGPRVPGTEGRGTKADGSKGRQSKAEKGSTKKKSTVGVQRGGKGNAKGLQLEEEKRTNERVAKLRKAEGGFTRQLNRREKRKGRADVCGERARGRRGWVEGEGGSGGMGASGIDRPPTGLAEAECGRLPGHLPAPRRLLAP